MAKLDPPISLQKSENGLRLTYIQDVILPLPDYETNFPPVNTIKYVIISPIFRNSMNIVLNYGPMKVSKPVINDLMNIN